jgi:hypothetical protein
MLNWITCYLSGNHDFTVTCEPGEIFLRCAHCGKRTHGWALSASQTIAPGPMPQPARAAHKPTSRTEALTRAA